MQEHEDGRSLKALEARIAKARGDRGSGDGTGSGEAQEESSYGDMLGMGMRIGTELVAAMIVSVGLGWLLDRWLGTRPWLMVAFFFLGAGAGILNVYRTVAGYGLAPGYKKPAGRGEMGQINKGARNRG